MNTNYAGNYPYFLEHVVIVADRFKISLREATERILKEEYPIFLLAMEAGGKTFSDIEKDMQETFIFKNHTKFYKANGVDRNWLGINAIE